MPRTKVKKRRTIVVMADHGIGDLLMTIPLIRNCSAHLNEEDILIIIVKTQREAGLLKYADLAANTEVWTADSGGARRYIKLAKIGFALRSLRPHILLCPMFRDCLRNVLWLLLVGARTSVGQTGKWLSLALNRHVRHKSGMHKVDRFIQIGIEAGFPPVTETDMTLSVTPVLKAKAREVMQGWSPDQQWIVLAPGSGLDTAHKRWPIHLFHELASMLLKHSTKIRIVAFGSQAEKELLESTVKNIDSGGDRCVVYAGSEFDLSLAILSQCHCMVAGCSGSSHMAVAAGIPVVGIYGPTNPGLTGPYSKQFRLVRIGLECSPCFRVEFFEGCGNPICLSMISAQKVFKAVLDSLDGVPTPPVPLLGTTKATKPKHLKIAYE